MQTNTQMIDEIYSYMDPSLTDFFETAVDAFPDEDEAWKWMPPKSVIEHFLSAELFPNKSNIRPIYESLATKRRKKRNNWLSKSIDNAKNFPYSSDKSFFKHLSSEILMDKNGFEKRYGEKTVSAAVTSLIKSMEAWKDKHGLMIDFPNFPFTGPRMSAKAINSLYIEDCEMEVCRIIGELYAYNLDNYYIQQPSDFLSNPIFSAQKGKAQISEIEGNLYAPVYSSDGYEVRFSKIPSTIANEYSAIDIFDSLDIEIMSFLLSNAKFELKRPDSLNDSQQTTIGEIARRVYKTKNPSQKQRENIARRLKRYVTPFEVSDEKTGFYRAWVLLSTISISDPDESGRRVVTYSFGKVIVESALRHSLVSVPSSKYAALETDHARLLYYKLQAERISLYYSGLTSCEYSFDFFVRTLLLRYKSISRSKTVIKEALDDIKNRTGIIESYVFDSRSVHINYLPLSGSEQNDYLSQNDSYTAFSLMDIEPNS